MEHSPFASTFTHSIRFSNLAKTSERMCFQRSSCSLNAALVPSTQPLFPFSTSWPLSASLVHGSAEISSDWHIGFAVIMMEQCP